MYKPFIFYCSPAETTRHVAKVMEKKLAGYSRRATVCALGKEKQKLSAIMREIETAKEQVCLCIGSPVYSSHALPLVMDFIARLPRRRRAYAVPFATWGGATSGLALAEMGEALQAREYRLIGAARVVAVHSLMWEADNPVGAGHPNVDDDRLIENLVAAVESNLERPEPLKLPGQALCYQPEAATAEMRKLNLEIARGILPQRVVNEDLCTQCGLCVDQCPVAALTLTPPIRFTPIIAFSASTVCAGARKKPLKRIFQPSMKESGNGPKAIRKNHFPSFLFPAKSNPRKHIDRPDFLLGKFPTGL